jgi:alanine racemase
VTLRVATVDLAAIYRNVQALAQLVATPVMAVVKADGYGHGAVEVASAAYAAGAEWLGVVDIDEAMALRMAGVTAPVLSWLHDPAAQFDEAVAARVDLGVNYIDQLERVAAASGRAEVHIKVDTGLSRNGAPEAEWAGLFARAAELERRGQVHVRGIFSHLANAGSSADRAQIALFDSAIAQATDAGLTPSVVHLAATAGAIAEPASRYSLVRIGLGCYGLSPFENRDSAAIGLSPAMELAATIASVKSVRSGSGVSYGYSYSTSGQSTLALVPIGYADGVPRQASNSGPVSINGKRYTVSGRVAMDQFVVDVGNDAVAVGDRAVLFGDPATGVPSASEWADAANTINYDIVTGIGARVPRRYVP